VECDERQEHPAKRCVHIFQMLFNRFFPPGAEFFDGGDMRPRYGRTEQFRRLKGAKA
jgi:hypothetical protein